MTQGKSDHFSKDGLAENRHHPGRGPQLTGISSLHFRVG